MEKKKEADRAPASGYLSALSEQARLERERMATAQVELEKQDAAYQAHFDRWVERIERWAMNKSRDELAERFSLALVLLIETRKTSRARGRSFDKLAEIAKDVGARAEATRAVARDSIRRELMQTAARRKGPATKLAKDKDGKQAAKGFALELWKERFAGKHPNLRTVEQYATEVMRRCPVLESSKVICGWSAKWTKQAKAGETPAC